MQKIYLNILNIGLTLGFLNSCVTPSQRDAMQKEISSLKYELRNVNNGLKTQTKQTEQNLKTTLTSQSEVEQLQAEISENAGNLDALKMQLDRIEKMASEIAQKSQLKFDETAKTLLDVQTQLAFFTTQNTYPETKVYPSQKIKDSFNPKSLKAMEQILKYDYERGWYKNVILKSSMVIQASNVKADMLESALKFRGEAKYKLLDYAGAVTDLTHYLEMNSKGLKKSRAMLLLGDSYVFLKQNIAAKAYYTECAKTFANNKEGIACAQRLKQL